MFITALCPTYRHPDLLANSVELWRRQTYPKHLRRLIILDDAETFENGQEGEDWKLYSAKDRFYSLPNKYNTLLSLAPLQSEAFLVWEDDDIYLPDYVERHVAALQKHAFTKPDRVLSDYTGKVLGEDSNGRFHSTLGFRAELMNRIGGWPETRRADFDQQLITRLTHFAGRSLCPFEGLLDHEIPFVYSWHTGAAHCQSTMNGGDDETWYERGATSYKPVPYVGWLVPQLDSRTVRLASEIGRNL